MIDQRKAGSPSKSRRLHLYLLAGVACAALLLRFGYIAQVAGHPFIENPILDSKIYHDQAQRLLSEGSICDGPFYQGPLYPAFLAASYLVLGDNPMAVRLLQMLLGVLTVVLVYLVGHTLFDRRVGQVAAAVAALLKPLVFYGGALLAATIVTCLFSASFLLSLKGLKLRSWKLLASAGILLGLAALGRANILFAAPAVIVYSLAAIRPLGRSALLAGAFCCGLFVAILPVTVRNYVVSGELVFIQTGGGITFYAANNPASKGIYRLPPELRFSTDFDLKRESTVIAEREEAREAGSMSPGEVSSYWYKRGLSFIAGNPVGALKADLFKLAMFWNNYESPSNFDIQDFEKRSWVLRFITLPYGLMASFALVGTVLVLRRRGASRFLISVLAAYIAGLVIFYVNSRLRLPVAPVLAVLAGFALIWTWDQFARRRWKKLLAMAPVLLVAFLVTHYDLGIGTDLPETHINLGRMYADLGAYSDAEKEYLRALELDRESTGAAMALAVLYLKSGETQRSFDYFRRAIESAADSNRVRLEYANLLLRAGKPHLALAEYDRISIDSLNAAVVSFNKGLAYQQIGRLDRAIDAFYAAARTNPEPRVLFKLGGALFASGRYSEALEVYRRLVQVEPNSHQAYTNLGMVFRELGQPDSALAALEEALRIEPRNNMARNLLNRPRNSP